MLCTPYVISVHCRSNIDFQLNLYGQTNSVKQLPCCFKLTLAQILWILILKFHEHILWPTHELNYHSIYCKHESSGIYPVTWLIFSFGTYHLQLGMYFYYTPLKEQWVATCHLLEPQLSMLWRSWLMGPINFRLFIYKLILFHFWFMDRIVLVIWNKPSSWCHTWWKPVEEIGRCHITKANYVSFEVIMITSHKMVFFKLPGNKTTKKLRLIFNKLLLQTN